MARILVAEDDADVLQLIALTLELDGHQVVNAASGDEVLRHAMQARPDVIVLDVMMPRVDGLTTLRQLRQQPLTRDIPVVLLSAKAQHDDIEAGMQAGATCYVTKPFEPDYLAAEVERVVATS
ncbi:MAG: response regulator [Acidimicrobiia bacterium]|nr:response regulator [Acidimicrobiia bacterium]